MTLPPTTGHRPPRGLQDRLRERLRAAREGGEDGVALLLVIMMMLVVTSLSMLVLGVVIAQVQPTALAQKSTITINGAQAGVDAALSQIRSSVGAPNAAGNAFGNRTALPCTLQGTVGAASDRNAYAVTIEYYDTDPTDLADADRASHRLVCTAGSGLAVVPAFALIKSAGTASGRSVPRAASTSGDRTIQSLYAFKVSNVNIPGGLFYSVTNRFCLEADSEATGAKVTYTAAVNCKKGDPLQTWVYDTDYTIKLADSLNGQALCLTLASQTAVDFVTLTPCGTKQTNQLFSYEGGAKFRGQNAQNTDYGAVCLYAGAKSGPVEGSYLKGGPDGCASANDEWGSFSPEPKVGAGAASKTTNQIVNYLEFGRCMDVTNGAIGSSYMIVYPCKQDPSTAGGKLNWNHKWYYTEGTETAPTTAAQRITVKVNNADNNAYCLSVQPPGASNTYVTFVKPCNASDVKQAFVRTWALPGNYASSYTFKDTWGRCLSLGPKAQPSGSVKWSTIVAATCTGGSEQKWNAPAGLQDAAVSDTRETTYDRP